MFGPNSRYAKSRIVDVTTATGKRARAVTLRRLPPTAGTPTEVKGVDRLDVIAHRKYGDSTKFWRIADANTELEANRLVAADRPDNPVVAEEIRIIQVPEE